MWCTQHQERAALLWNVVFCYSNSVSLPLLLLPVSLNSSFRLKLIAAFVLIFLDSNRNNQCAGDEQNRIFFNGVALNMRVVIFRSHSGTSCLEKKYLFVQITIHLDKHPLVQVEGALSGVRGPRQTHTCWIEQKHLNTASSEPCAVLSITSQKNKRHVSLIVSRLGLGVTVPFPCQLRNHHFCLTGLPNWSGV